MKSAAISSYAARLGEYIEGESVCKGCACNPSERMRWRFIAQKLPIYDFISVCYEPKAASLLQSVPSCKYTFESRKGNRHACLLRCMDVRLAARETTRRTHVRGNAIVLR